MVELRLALSALSPVTRTALVQDISALADSVLDSMGVGTTLRNKPSPAVGHNLSERASKIICFNTTLLSECTNEGPFAPDLVFYLLLDVVSSCATIFESEEYRSVYLPSILKTGKTLCIFQIDSCDSVACNTAFAACLSCLVAFYRSSSSGNACGACQIACLEGMRSLFKDTERPENRITGADQFLMLDRLSCWLNELLDSLFGMSM